jgi:hypothetical protein
MLQDQIKFGISAVLACFLGIVSLDMKKPYPTKIIEFISEPYIRCLCYLAVYFLCIYDVLIGLLWMMMVVLLHFDFINLIKLHK